MKEPKQVVREDRYPILGGAILLPTRPATEEEILKDRLAAEAARRTDK